MRARPLAVVAVLLLTLVGCTADAPPPEPGVAAVVDGDEIEVEAVERRYEELVAAEGVGVEEDQAPTVRARILSQLIIAHVTRTGARELGVDVEDDEVEAIREDLVEAVGGPAAFQLYMARSGVSPERVDEELRSLALLHGVGEEIVPDDEVGDDDERDAAVQDAARAWLEDRLDAAEITVDRAYGSWDPDRRQVVPPDGSRA